MLNGKIRKLSIPHAREVCFWWYIMMFKHGTVTGPDVL